ncbi:MAG TPA: hypothetical protein VEK13_04420 [Thermoplasmata archaeon]|nr:hypothetical protein [Thermoplasmata archaeon]
MKDTTRSAVAVVVCIAMLMLAFMVLLPETQASAASLERFSIGGLLSQRDPTNLTLASPNAQSTGDFGLSVANSGTTVVVGAPGETASGYDYAGHAYIFNAKTGTLISTLTSSNPQPSGAFGSSVSISGTTVVVGAPEETASGVGYAGHAYVFKATTGALIRTLTSSNPQPSGAFGSSVSISGTTVVVGAPSENASGYSDAGHAYDFKATTGALISTLTSPNAQLGGSFGHSVAIGGTTVVVGAPYETALGYSEAGHAYVSNATTGALIRTLTSPKARFDGFFGYSVAIRGTIVVVGAVGETASGHGKAGRAYVFSATTGALIRTLTSPNAQASGAFGSLASISGTTVVVGAPYEKASGYRQGGHAYVFIKAT